MLLCLSFFRLGVERWPCPRKRWFAQHWTNNIELTTRTNIEQQTTQHWIAAAATNNIDLYSEVAIFCPSTVRKIFIALAAHWISGNFSTSHFTLLYQSPTSGNRGYATDCSVCSVTRFPDVGSARLSFSFVCAALCKPTTKQRMTIHARCTPATHSCKRFSWAHATQPIGKQFGHRAR